MHISAVVLAVWAVVATAAPSPASSAVDPNSVTGTKCTAKNVSINGHDINVALLGICGGIAGKIQKCQGNPESTTGKSGTATLSLKAVTSGQKIDISKGRWEHCMKAARATCGDSPFTSTCKGGANGNKGDVEFSLSKS